MHTSFSREGLGKLLAGCFEQVLARTPAGRFPNTKREQQLIVAADFSGQHTGELYETYAFLVFDKERNQDWVAEQSALREKFLGPRRMSFKRLGDAIRRRALKPFLEAAERIEGVVVAIAIAERAAL
jgi:hypothetical protein